MSASMSAPADCVGMVTNRSDYHIFVVMYILCLTGDADDGERERRGAETHIAVHQQDHGQQLGVPAVRTVGSAEGRVGECRGVKWRG